MLRSHKLWSLALISSALLAVACAGSTPAADDPSVASGPVIPEKTEVTPPSDEDAQQADAESKKAAKQEAPEPNFTPDMSVEDAIKAIPQDTERLNVDQETLSKPLEDQSLYEPCKPGTARFTLRVAIWRGKAVAIDLSTTPKNPKLAECLKGRIRELTWPAKVPSLNTVEYSL